MVERLSKRPKITRGEDDYLPGNITEIELHNFMTFNHMKCKPGSRLNLVIGPNGSGKSSIVCAICLGLGGDPQILGRAGSIGAYVKRGEESGFIKIILRGESGDEQISITRKIDTSKKSEWLLNESKDAGGYLPLYKAALEGEWEEASKFIDGNPTALSANISVKSETALHIAVGTNKNSSFVSELVNKMLVNELALTNEDKETALHTAAIVGNIDAAKFLVGKSSGLLEISSEPGLHIHMAARHGQKSKVRYLLDVNSSPLSDESGVKLLVSVITAELSILLCFCFQIR